MVLTIAIGAGIFVAMMAIIYFGYEQAEKDRADRAESERRRRAPHEGRTADELIFDLEHRIDSDLQEAAAAMRRATAARPSGA